MFGEQLGGVAAFRHLDVGRVETAGGEHPDVAFGGDLSGEVAVGADDGVAAGALELVGQLRDLVLGRRRAQWGDTDLRTLGGQGDRDRVHRALDDDRGSTGGKERFDRAEELRLHS